MQVAKISHVFIGSMLNQMKKESTASISKEYIARIKEECEGPRYSDKEKEFLNILFNQGEKNYFIIPSFIPNEPSIGIVNHDLNAIMFLTVNTTNIEFIEYINSPLVLDLMHLHSYKKGEGKKLMSLFKEIQLTLNIPGILFTETRKNVRYFEKHGFKNLGQLGHDNEYLMILE